MGSMPTLCLARLMELQLRLMESLIPWARSERPDGKHQSWLSVFLLLASILVYRELLLASKFCSQD